MKNPNHVERCDRAFSVAFLAGVILLFATMFCLSGCQASVSTNPAPTTAPFYHQPAPASPSLPPLPPATR